MTIIEQRKLFRNEIRFFESLRKKKGYKQFWTLVKVEEKYKEEVFRKSNLKIASSIMGISVKKINNYYKKIVDDKD